MNCCFNIVFILLCVFFKSNFSMTMLFVLTNFHFFLYFIYFILFFSCHSVGADHTLTAFNL